MRRPEPQGLGRRQRIGHAAGTCPETDMPRHVLLFRCVVLALAAVYFLDRFTVETWVWNNFGWQFRYLTIWGLTGSLIVAALMLTPRYGRPDRHGAVLVSVVGVINLLVVFSYWRLFFTDPTLVNGDKQVIAYREYYLHLLGPALQWLDMLVLKRAFRVPWRTALWLAVLVVVYVVWSEAVVAPLNDDPVGSVTAGLPYPFLNDMAPPARALFYLSIFGTGLVFIALLRGCQAAIDRFWPRGAGWIGAASGGGISAKKTGS
jgi:hypothetical protein